MGSIIGMLGGIVGSCCGACAGYCACTACKSLANFKGSRIPYLIMMFLSLVLAAILRYHGGPFVLDLYVYHWNVCTSDACYGIGAVYRITFALFVFFAIFAGMSLSTGCVKAKVDGGHWLLKSCLYIGLLVAAFLLPNEVFTATSNIFKPIAGVFLVIQIVVLIEFVYSWNEGWLEKDWKKGILFVAVVAYLVALVALILLFVYFGGSGCTQNKTFIAITFIWTLVFTGLSVFVEGGGILPSSMMTIYVYWLCYSAITSDNTTTDVNNDHCNPMQPNNAGKVLTGFIISAASCSYAGWSLSNHPDRVMGGKKSTTVPLVDEDHGEGEAPAATGDQELAVPDDDVKEGEEIEASASTKKAAEAGKTSAKFHFIMMGAVAYACMLLSNWGGGLTTTALPNVPPDPSETFSMWVKLISEWTTCTLYTWSLVAPMIFKNRAF